MAERPTTLRDVAAASGVAVSTVSRALSQPGRINPRTAQRVQATAAELGYSPNGPARALSSGRTSMIALLLPDLVNPFYVGIVHGTQARLRDAGYMHILIDTEESDQVEESALLSLKSTVDGVILGASRLSDERLESWAQQLKLVAINRDPPVGGGPSVVIDTPGGALQGLQHLASLGHRHVAYAGGPDTSWSDSHRRSVLVPAAHQWGITLTVLGPFAPRREAGAAAADAVVHCGATGVLAFNDLLAFGVLERLADRGIDVPGRISVVGCDNIFGADFVRPALTTIAAPTREAGRLAAELLLGQLQHAGAPVAAPAHLATHLVVRASTGPVPG
jgi:LacI family transcriptional regulator/LacI family repressor for deo operon, udp, cdd, tsx, nupC, and nupG